MINNCDLFIQIGFPCIYGITYFCGVVFCWALWQPAHVRLSVCVISETEAVEACKWLRAAGFPQYAQMYEGKTISYSHIL